MDDLEVSRSIFYDGVLKHPRLYPALCGYIRVERQTLRELCVSVLPKITNQGLFPLHPTFSHTRDLLTFSGVYAYDQGVPSGLQRFSFLLFSNHGIHSC